MINTSSNISRISATSLAVGNRKRNKNKKMKRKEKKKEEQKEETHYADARCVRTRRAVLHSTQRRDAGRYIAFDAFNERGGNYTAAWEGAPLYTHPHLSTPRHTQATQVTSCSVTLNNIKAVTRHRHMPRCVAIRDGEKRRGSSCNTALRSNTQRYTMMRPVSLGHEVLRYGVTRHAARCYTATRWAAMPSAVTSCDEL
jgi:hypothetical protein